MERVYLQRQSVELSDSIVVFEGEHHGTMIKVLGQEHCFPFAHAISYNGSVASLPTFFSSVQIDRSVVTLSTQRRDMARSVWARSSFRVEDSMSRCLCSPRAIEGISWNRQAMSEAYSSKRSEDGNPFSGCGSRVLLKFEGYCSDLNATICFEMKVTLCNYKQIQRARKRQKEVREERRYDNKHSLVVCRQNLRLVSKSLRERAYDHLRLRESAFNASRMNILHVFDLVSLVQGGDVLSSMKTPLLCRPKGSSSAPWPFLPVDKSDIPSSCKIKFEPRETVPLEFTHN